MASLNFRQRIDRAAARSNNVVHKLSWGIRAVGIRSALRGSFRLLKLRLNRPPQSQISLRSGPVLRFSYPSQFPQTLVMFGDFIDPEYAFLREVARPDWVIADVGAAIGQFAIYTAKLPCSLVHAFEPSGANVVTFLQNIACNGVCDKVKVHRVALSDSSGEAVFETLGQTWMSQISSHAAQKGEVVPVRTLSEELEHLGISHLSVLKVNVAGFEPKVLAGATAFLEAGGADILILLLGLPSLAWYEKISLCGYRFFYYQPVKKTLFEVKSFDEECVLRQQPWPARHIIAVHSSAIAKGICSPISVH